MANEHPESLLHRGPFRNLEAGRSAESQVTEGTRHHYGPGLPPINIETHRERWMELLKLVNEDYPYCTMYGVHVVDGTITACEQIQRSLMLGNQQAVATEIQPSLFDMKWQALEALCISIGTGRLVEVKFHDAKPVIVITKEGGRRFKGMVKKLTRSRARKG